MDFKHQVQRAWLSLDISFSPDCRHQSCAPIETADCLNHTHQDMTFLRKSFRHHRDPGSIVRNHFHLDALPTCSPGTKNPSTALAAVPHPVSLPLSPPEHVLSSSLDCNLRILRSSWAIIPFSVGRFTRAVWCRLV